MSQNIRYRDYPLSVNRFLLRLPTLPVLLRECCFTTVVRICIVPAEKLIYSTQWKLSTVDNLQCLFCDQRMPASAD